MTNTIVLTGGATVAGDVSRNADGFESLRKQFSTIPDTKLDQEIDDEDLPHLAVCFGNVELYVNSLGLDEGEKIDVKKSAQDNGNQIAVIKALGLWKGHTPCEVTFRAIINIMLSLKKGENARGVFQYLAKKL